jgi:hypothetical protein
MAIFSAVYTVVVYRTASFDYVIRTVERDTQSDM